MPRSDPRPADEQRVLHASWRAFERQCVAPDASAADRHTLRTAYYGGAYALFRLLGAAAALPQSEQVKTMDGLTCELDVFHAVRGTAVEGHL